MGLLLRNSTSSHVEWSEIGTVTALPYLNPRGGAQFPIAVRLRTHTGDVLLDIPDVFRPDRRTLAAAITNYRARRAVYPSTSPHFSQE